MHRALLGDGSFGFAQDLPLASVTDSTATFVSVFVTVTVTPGITAPWASATVPVRLALNCCAPAEAGTTSRRITIANQRDIWPPTSVVTRPKRFLSYYVRRNCAPELRPAGLQLMGIAVRIAARTTALMTLVDLEFNPLALRLFPS